MHIYRIAFISLILTLICYLHPAFGFRYQNARWRLMDLPIPCYLNTASMPKELAIGDVEVTTIRSLAAWNEAADLQIFEYAGRIQLEAPLADDGWNAISFVLTDWLEVTDRLSVNRFTAAMTCTWSVRDAIGAPPRQGFVKNDFLRAFDIAINAENYRWTIGAKVNQYDLQSAITHELGHVLSLGHPDADPRPADAPTMVERMFPNNTKLRALEPDDIAGVQSIYRKVSGTLRENVQWENMLIIDGDVIVPRGVSLKINHSTPQTIVHFSPESKLIIEGGLTVGAEAFKRVLFTGIDGSQWGGLEIHANDKVCQIADSIFEFAQTPLTLLSAENVSVKNCEFRQNSIGIQGADGRQIAITGCAFDHAETAINLQSTTDVSVENCEFRGNQNAVVVVDGQQVTIGGVFRENGVGVEIQSSSKVEISRSILEQNKVGIRIIDTTAQICSSQFMENTVGLEIHSVQPIRLRENSVIQNEIGIRVVSGAVDLGKAPDDLGHNNLLSNTVWNLVLEAPSPAPIFAQGNYWGELKSAEIDDTIRDDEEDADLPPVQFQPTLDEFQLVQAGWHVGFVGIQREGAQDSEGLGDGKLSEFPAGCQFLLFPVIQLPALEGEWKSQLTVPADAPLGDYYLWMMVDADDDVIECSEYNRVVYRARPIRIGGEIEEEEQSVNPHGKRPIMWARLKTELFQNFPNPFNPETWIPYQLSEDADVIIRIYDTKGQLVRIITLGNKQAGVYVTKDKAAYWDGRDSLGEKVASGVYVYTLHVREAIPRIGAGDFRATRKMVMLK